MPFVEISARDAKQPRPANSIMTLREWCERSGFSTVTGWRIMKAGDGPKVTRVGNRRIGIREDHHAEWLDGLIQSARRERKAKHQK